MTVKDALDAARRDADEMMYARVIDESKALRGKLREHLDQIEKMASGAPVAFSDRCAFIVAYCRRAREGLDG